MNGSEEQTNETDKEIETPETLFEIEEIEIEEMAIDGICGVY